MINFGVHQHQYSCLAFHSDNQIWANFRSRIFNLGAHGRRGGDDEDDDDDDDNDAMAAVEWVRRGRRVQYILYDERDANGGTVAVALVHVRVLCTRASTARCYFTYGFCCPGKTLST